MIRSLVLFCKTEISKTNVSFRVNQDVFRFEVAEQDLLLVDVFHSENELGRDKPGKLLVKVLVHVQLHRKVTMFA